MTRLVLDAATLAKLRYLKESFEFCDESGRVLGRFVPRLDPSQYEGLEPTISAEELERRRGEDSFTTAEVLTHLRSLEDRQ